MLVFICALACFSWGHAQTSTSVSIELPSGQVLAPLVLSNGYLSQPVQTSLAESGRASWKFTITVPGQYALLAMVETQSDSPNSFLVNIDAEPEEPTMIWDIPARTGPQKRIVSWRGQGTPEKNEFAPKYFALNPGEHELILRGCEAGVKLQSLTVVKRPSPVQQVGIVK